MISSRIRIAVVTAALIFTSELYAQNAGNPIQIALLRWYQANQTASFATCASPQGVAFDGAHIWVACTGASLVQELNASDGTVIRTVGVTAPQNLLFDGANIWASSYSSGNLTKIPANPLTGPTAYPIGSGIYGMTFDGASVWVANASTNTLNKFNIATGMITTTINLTTCTTPVSLGYDESHIWVSCEGSNTVQEWSPTGGTVPLSTKLTGAQPGVIAFDGTNIWVANSGGNSVTKITAVMTTTCTLPPCLVGTYAVGSDPFGIAFDGKYIWVANYNDGTVSKLMPNNPLATVPGSPFSTGAGPSFVGFDGGNIWISNSNSSSLSKF